MNTLPPAYGGSSLSCDHHRYGISNTCTDHTTANSICGDSNTNVGNVSGSYNNTINVGVNEESFRIKAWLSPLEHHRRHQDVSNRRLDGVGDWVLRRNEFKLWCGNQDSSGNPTLLCCGGQGVGKTFISSLVIDTLREQTCGQNIAVLSLYCDYRAQEDQSTVNIIGSLLSQVASRAVRIPIEIQTAFESKERGGQTLRLPDMLKLFAKTISSIGGVYICFDGLDELLPQNRSELLRALRQLIRDAPNIRLFLTGRPYIRKELDKHLTKEAYIIDIVPDKGDITRYVSRKIEDDDNRNPELMPDDLKHDILTIMLERASEMFLLVALNMDEILGETSLAKRKKMLRKVATTGVDLDSVYAQTLRRIREQKGDRARLGMEVLRWVSHSWRPLRVGELRHALAVETESTDLDPENICPQDTILGSCLGLVVVDEETSVVRLIHYTLHEYLRLPSILPDAHKTLGLTCLAYLSSDQVKELPADKVPDLRGMPFLEYSSLYWGTHAREELSDGAKSLALELLNRYDNHVSATLLSNRMRSSGYRSIATSLFTGLHCASFFGIVEVVAALIKVKGCDTSQRDCMGFTPLMWAARQGNEEVVSLLLARNDVNPNEPDNEGRTPLWWASHAGDDGVVRLLLACDSVSPDGPDNEGGTPLSWASFWGNEGVVRLLLARNDVNPDKPDSKGLTPLSQACLCGHEGVVRLLLSRDDVNPNGPGDGSLTPLICASVYGQEGVVRLLLARDGVDPNKPDGDGHTPLSQASIFGHEGVVRLLLGRGDINPDKPDNNGRTPLLKASFCGHEGVVRLLLASNGVNPDKPDDEGQTPLQVASIRGYREVVVLLRSWIAAVPHMN